MCEHSHIFVLMACSKLRIWFSFYCSCIRLWINRHLSYSIWIINSYFCHYNYCPSNFNLRIYWSITSWTRCRNTYFILWVPIISFHLNCLHECYTHHYSYYKHNLRCIHSLVMYDYSRYGTSYSCCYCPFCHLSYKSYLHLHHDHLHRPKCSSLNLSCNRSYRCLIGRWIQSRLHTYHNIGKHCHQYFSNSQRSCNYYCRRFY